jgi:hypothetical protein
VAEVVAIVAGRANEVDRKDATAADQTGKRTAKGKAKKFHQENFPE